MLDDVFHLRQPIGRQLRDESRRLPREQLRGQPAGCDQLNREEDEEQNERDETDLGKQAENEAHLRGTGNPEGQDQRGDDPFAPGFQNPRHDHSHGAAAESQYDRDHGLAVEPDKRKKSVQHHLQPGKVAGIFQDGKHQKEGRHGRQYDAEGQCDAHGDLTVGPHQEIPQDTERDMGHDLDNRRKKNLPEDDFLEKVDDRAGGKDTHKFINHKEDAEQHHRAPQRVDGYPVQETGES